MKCSDKKIYEKLQETVIMISNEKGNEARMLPFPFLYDYQKTQASIPNFKAYLLPRRMQ